MTARVRTRTIERDDGSTYVTLLFECPGCGHLHGPAVRGRGAAPAEVSTWEWNGSLDAPTISPSLLVRHNGDPPLRCHSLVRDGRIQFLADCSHALAGQTVELPLVDEVVP